MSIFPVFPVKNFILLIFIPPVSYFMNDAKEGDMLCCCVASHNKVNFHCRVCDVQYDNMLDVYVDCSMKRPDYIEMLVDA